MPPDEPEATEPAQPPPPEPAPPAPDPAPPAVGRRATDRAWMLALLAALLAGVGAWLVGERTYQYFKPSEEAASQAYEFARLNKETAQANAGNGALSFGALGALLGLGLGLAGGLSRRSMGGALAGAVVGLILGAAAGALPSLWLMPYQWRHRNDDPSGTELLMPLLIHLGLWSGLGAAAGLAFGLGRSGPRPGPILGAALGGLIGAALGTAAFELIGAAAFPVSRTIYPFSDTPGTRLLARLCVVAFAALGAALTVPSRDRAKVAAPAGAGLE